MQIKRRKTRQIHVGNIAVGGGAPISVQSMIKAPPHDAAAILRQVRALERAGCELIRLAVPDKTAAQTFAAVKQKTKTPLIADIHFNKRLALLAIEAGADCVRINPGNIGKRDDFAAVLDAARGAGIPVRIGVNAGSLEKDILDKFGSPTPQALAESALRAVEVAEKHRFHDVKVSLKASGAGEAIEAYRLFSRQCDAPLHIGVTEAGSEFSGCIRSAVGMGVLLAEGIGDTMRVSLSAPPQREVVAAWQILASLGIRRRGITVIGCPTCGRAGGDISTIVNRLEKRTSHITAPVTVAVMGCAVNGPGEAREADVGAALAKSYALIFSKGAVIKKVRTANVLDELIKQINLILAEKR